MASTTPKKPRVILFDIGGVCVVSPFQAILDYETRLSIPPGWVNHSISASNPHGAWPRLERGDIPLDAAFFAEFKRDLSNEARWRAFYTRSAATKTGQVVAPHQIPPVPDIDAQWLYWEMMRVARTPDPHMYPALQRLRAEADRQRAQGGAGGLVVAALSNTCIFPAEHAFNDVTTSEGRQNRELKGLFDVFVSSAHVGMRKPEEPIYRYAVTRVAEWAKYQWPAEAGLKAEDFVFLDDIGTNLRTARKVGMGTIKVQLGRANLAVAELEKITGLQLSDAKSRL